MTVTLAARTCASSASCPREKPKPINAQILAIVWALEAGFTAIANEVPLPRAPYRANVGAARFDEGAVEIGNS